MTNPYPGTGIPTEEKLLDRWRLAPLDMRQSLLVLIRQLAKPYDPRYQAYELAEHHRYLAREKLRINAKYDEPDLPETA